MIIETSNNRQFNTGQFNETGILGGFSDSLPENNPPGILSNYSELEKYFLEVRNQDLDLLFEINTWVSATITDKVNEPSQIELIVPALELYASSLTFPNIIYVRDQYKNLVNAFHIVSFTKQMNNEGNQIRRVEGESIIYQLSKELLIDYVADNISIKDLIVDWIDNYQVSNYSKIRFGKIDDSIGEIQITKHFNGISILKAIQELFTIAGIGTFYVSPYKRRFFWTANNPHIGKQIRVSHNMTNVEIIENSDNLANRIYLFGNPITNSNDESGRRINLTDAGEEFTYIQDDDSISQYGIHPIHKVEDLSEPSNLLEAAYNYLEAYKEPQRTVKVGLVDLWQSNPETYTEYEHFFLNDSIRVTHSDLDISELCTIYEIKYSLENPMIKDITLVNKQKSISDIIEKILDEIRKNEPPFPSNQIPNEPSLDEGSAGISEDYMRADAVIPIGDELIQAIADEVEDEIEIPELVWGTDIQPIGKDSSSGISYKIPFEDHVHKQRFPYQIGSGLDYSGIGDVTGAIWGEIAAIPASYSLLISNDGTNWKRLVLSHDSDDTASMTGSFSISGHRLKIKCSNAFVQVPLIYGSQDSSAVQNAFANVSGNLKINYDGTNWRSITHFEAS